MAAAKYPITLKTVLTLPIIGNNTQFPFTHVTMESDKYICIRQPDRVVIFDMDMPMKPFGFKMLGLMVDSALMHPNSPILALKEQIPGTLQHHLQLFNINKHTKRKSYMMPEQVTFWKWISPEILGLVTHTSVYHWSLKGASEPIKMFERTANLANNKIINYQCDPTGKWLVLIGIAPGTPERPQLVNGNMQLFSVDQQRSHAVKAHAASFAQFKVPGNENPSVLLSFARRTLNDAGRVISQLHVVELVAQPGLLKTDGDMVKSNWKPSFTKKKANLFFPPNYADDFPVSMLMSHKYGLIYVISNHGLLFVYELETATAVFRRRISSDPIFLTSEATSVGGFYAINRRGQVVLATVNEQTILNFVRAQVDEATFKFIEHAPPFAMQLANQAKGLIQKVTREAGKVVNEGRSKGPRAAVDYVAKESKHLLLTNSVKLWTGLNYFPPFHAVAEMTVPIAAHWAEKYNLLIQDLTQKGYGVAGFLPFIPVEEISEAFKQGEANLKRDGAASGKKKLE